MKMKNILYIFILLGWVGSVQGQTLSTDSFCLANKYSFGDSARYTRPILADMNKDGKVDLVLYDFDQKKIKYHKGNNSSFDVTANVTTFTLNAISIAVGDINGDSYPDVAVLTNTNGSVATYTNTNGLSLNFYTNLSTPLSFSLSIENTTRIFLQPLANSSYQDIVVTCKNLFNSGYYILKNDGMGNFTTVPPFADYFTALSASGKPVVDFNYYNSDNFLDMAYTTSASGNNLVIINTTNDPLYDPSTITSTYTTAANASGNCEQIKSRDTNGDGDFDLLCLYSGTFGGLFPLINTGSSFVNAPVLISQITATDFFIEDFNQDNQLDYLSMNENTGRCFLNKGLSSIPTISLATNQHTFSVNTPSVAPYNNHFAVYDVDANGLSDIIATGTFVDSGSVRIIKNFTHPVIITSNNNAVSCSGSSVTISASTTNNITGFYNWSTGANNTPTISTTTAGSISAFYNFNLPNGGSCSLLSNHIIVTSVSGTLPTNMLSVSQTTNYCTNSSNPVNYVVTATTTGTNNSWIYNNAGSTNTITFTNSLTGNTFESITYTLVAELGGCYKTDTITVIAYESPEISPDPVSSFCLWGTYTISPVLLTTNVGLTGYSLTYGSNTYTTVGFPIFTATSATINSFTLVAFSSMCQSDPWVHTFNIDPKPIINAIFTPSVCGSSTITISYDYNSDYSYYTQCNLFSSVNYVITHSITSTTQYSVTITDSNTTCKNDSIFTIYVVSTPSLQNMPAQTGCSGTPFNLTTIGSASSYTWINGSTGVVISNSQNPTVIEPNSGNYNYMVIGSNGTVCASSQATVAVTVLQSPIISLVSSSSTSVCAGSSVSITVNGANTYTLEPGSVFSSTGNFVVTPSTTTTYTISGVSSSGCTGTINKIINIIPSPAITVSGNSVICIGETATLTAIGVTNYTWTNSFGAVVSNANVLIKAPTTTESFVVTGSNGNCNSQTIIAITVNPLPNVSITTTSFAICPIIDTTKIYVLPGSGSFLSDFTFSWTPTNKTTSSIKVTQKFSQSYIVVVTSTLTGCRVALTQTIISKPTPAIIATPNNTIVCEGSFFTLNASGGINYSWQPSTTTANGSSFTSSISSQQTYTVYGVGLNNCIWADTVTVSIYPKANCLGTPTAASAFSPNGDGLNENFYIEGINEKNNSVYIFDRWGVLLFSKENYHNTNNAWNGAYKGKAVPSGTYFYIINLKDTNETQKGWVEITGN